MSLQSGLDHGPSLCILTWSHLSGAWKHIVPHMVDRRHVDTHTHTHEINTNQNHQDKVPRNIETPFFPLFSFFFMLLENMKLSQHKTGLIYFLNTHSWFYWEWFHECTLFERIFKKLFIIYIFMCVNRIQRRLLLCGLWLKIKPCQSCRGVSGPVWSLAQLDWELPWGLECPAWMISPSYRPLRWCTVSNLPISSSHLFVTLNH